jgi:two-component system chemotaxis sensor kinase CheA
MTERELTSLSIYRNETLELCADLEDALLELEERPDDMDLVGRVFRSMHTIKGSGSMFGLEEIVGFTHEVETVYDHVRNRELEVTKELIDLTLAAKDLIMEMVKALSSGEEVDSKRVEELKWQFSALLPDNCEATRSKDGSDTQAGASSPADKPVSGARSAAYRIRFKPNQDIFQKGIDPTFAIEDLKGLGQCHVIAHTDNVPDLREMEPEGCHTWWDIILVTSKGVDTIWDVFIFMEGDAEVTVDQVDDGGFDYEEDEYKKLGEILVERGDISSDELRGILEEKKLVGENLVESGLVNENIVESALKEQSVVRNIRKERKDDATLQTLRVPAEKLDRLVNLVGELITLKANLNQATQGWGVFDLITKKEDVLDSLMKNNFKALSDIAFISEEVDRIAEEIRESSMSMRMMPIGDVFGRFRRLVRDLSGKLGREATLVTSGAETELDKTMIEKLNDPLVHLIRNCIDHGIEGPEDREANGKPHKGVIHLSAEHAGDSVLIRISDDGRGMDPEAIRAKAVEKGFISENQEITDREALMLVFAPGFSTAEKATSVSGRGVGMDVVKQSVDTLRGSVNIESSNNSGTSITLRIPLTLAIIDGLLVKIGAEHFVLPLLAVEECVELKEDAGHNGNGRHLIDVRGAAVPYIRLRDRFEINCSSPELEQVVIVSMDGNRFGFVVDSVVGEHQTVIKPLGSFYKAVKGVSGATILGDGSVALILDINNLYQEAKDQEKSLYGQ